MPSNLASSHNRGEYTAVLEQLLTRPTNPKLGLERMAELLGLVGCHPSPFKIIQVVGTNGKGSTVAFVESVLQQHGVSTGLFTSPHLCTARERIRINGAMVSESDFVLASRHVLNKSQAQKDPASFFECMLAMALWLFEKHKITVAILEAGLGGRLDATTAAGALILGVSTIDLDHQHILGATIEKIATEKIMAARAGQMVVSAEQIPAAKKIILDAKETLGFNLVFAPPCARPLGLLGQHQQKNAGLALALVHKLSINTTNHDVDRGLMNVNWPGRFEIISGDVDIVFDGAHNPSGILALVECLKNHALFKRKPLVIVYGSLQSQNARAKIELLLDNTLNVASIFLHEPNNPRAMMARDLKTLFLEQGMHDEALREFSTWDDVITHAKNLDAAIVVCGSLYSVGALRGTFFSLAMDPQMPTF